MTFSLNRPDRVDETNETIDYESMTVTQLREIAKERGLTGYSSLNKADLIQLLRDNE